ncbi:hypothetical protein I4U23_021803 [Adineta vaga]|nr:hypothetical protein I4U23_021803 [Adineta vaga]
MSILDDEKYSQTLFAFCDICYIVIDAEKESYYKCLSCKDFVVCAQCLPLTKTKHSLEHKFSSRKGIPNQFLWIEKNVGITCDRCFRRDFPGRLYHCTTCNEFNVCEKCFPYVSLCHHLKLKPNTMKAKLNHKLMIRRAVAALTNPDSPFYGQPFDVVIDWPLTATRHSVNEQENKLIFQDVLHLQGQLKNSDFSEKMRKKIHQDNIQEKNCKSKSNNQRIKDTNLQKEQLRKRRLQDYQQRQHLLKDVEIITGTG